MAYSTILLVGLGIMLLAGFAGGLAAGPSPVRVLMGASRATRTALDELRRLRLSIALYSRLLRYVRGHWPLLLLAIVAMLGTTVTTLARPWPMQVIVDSVLGDKSAPVWITTFVNELGDRMRRGLKEAAEAAGYAVQVTGYGSMFHTHFTKEKIRSVRQAEDADQELLRELHVRMLAHGIFFYQGHVGFISSAHNEADIDKALAAAGEVLSEIKKERRR